MNIKKGNDKQVRYTCRINEVTIDFAEVTKQDFLDSLKLTFGDLSPSDIATNRVYPSTGQYVRAFMYYV